MLPRLSSAGFPTVELTLGIYACNESELTKELVVSFVEKVIVHPDYRIEIVWLQKAPYRKIKSAFKK